jgi:lysophospholipid acyltransferase (LPLAT)-like uncharacterized protein
MLPAAAMLKRLIRSAPAQSALAWLAAAYLQAALRTTRWRIEGEAHLAPYAAGEPCIAAFWHETLPLMPALWLNVRRRGPTPRMHVMVSRHRDGRFIGAVVRHLNMQTVHGSSARAGGATQRDKGGAAAARLQLAALAAGEHVAITPDGPRGPRRQAAPGVAQIAALSGRVVLPLAAQTTRRRELPSWDRMRVPLPFGRGVLVCGAPIAVPQQGWQAALPRIEAALTEAVSRADALCQG